jgi:putative membrane protein
MSARDFLDPAAKQKVSEAIEAIELQTAAEVVVAVRKVSGHYRHSDYLLGSLLALVGLLVFLFHPEPFDEDLFPLAEALLFVTGVTFSAGIDPLRRVLTSRKLREANVKMAAHAAFYEMGVSRTTGRTGVLVYVSLLERCVEVAVDIGVDTASLDGAWKEALKAMQAGVEQGNFPRFLDGLLRMGPPLGKQLPRSADDVNELSNEVR